VALVFIVGLAALTIDALVRRGGEVLVPAFFSLLVLALFGFGIVGALRQPPDD
jgi:ABC-type transport system involved in cytochrome c biogenesis permease component